MPDLSPVSPGEPFRFIDADVANAILEMARAYRNGSLGRLGGLPTSSPQGDPVSVVVQNRTGSALDQYGVVGFSDALVPYATSAAEFKRRPQFRAAAPTASGPFGIVQQPLANWVSDSTPNTIGRAVVSGCTVCKLNVTSSGDTYAAPTTSTTELTTQSTPGPARILAKESGTGSGKWGLVLLTGNEASSSSALTYEGYTLQTAVAMDHTTNVNVTNWIKTSNASSSTYLDFPSDGYWRVDAILSGDINNTTPSAMVLNAQLINDTGCTFLSPYTTGGYATIASAFADDASGNFVAYGTANLCGIARVQASGGTRRCKIEGILIGGGTYTSYIGPNTYTGYSFVMMHKLASL